VLNAVKIADGLGGFPDGLLSSFASFGEQLASIGDLDGDGVGDVAVFSITSIPGEFWVLFLYANGTVKSEQKIGNATGGFGGALDANDVFGYALSAIGTRPENGRLVIAAGAFNDDDGGTNRGALWLLEMDANGTVFNESKISDTEGTFDAVLDNSDAFGYGVCVLAGFSEDVDEVVLAVGATNDDDGAVDAGAVYVLWVSWTNLTVQRWTKISNGNGELPAATIGSFDSFGVSVASVGDVDNDGVGDLVVGAYGDNGDGGADRGAVYVLLLNAGNATVKEVQKISDITGGLAPGTLGNNDEFGISVAGLGDADGDGVPDVVVGARGDGPSDHGALYILFLNANGTVKNQSKIGTTDPADNNGNLSSLVEDDDAFGYSMAFLGDHDGDGIPFDLLVGAPFASVGGEGFGSVYVLSLNGTALETTTGTTATTATTGNEESDDGSLDTTGQTTIIIVVVVVGGLVVVVAVLAMIFGSGSSSSATAFRTGNKMMQTRGIAQDSTTSSEMSASSPSVASLIVCANEGEFGTRRR
jgi:hypothetical protein